MLLKKLRSKRKIKMLRDLFDVLNRGINKTGAPVGNKVDEVQLEVLEQIKKALEDIK